MYRSKFDFIIIFPNFFHRITRAWACALPMIVRWRRKKRTSLARAAVSMRILTLFPIRTYTQSRSHPILGVRTSETSRWNTSEIGFSQWGRCPAPLRIFSTTIKSGCRMRKMTLTIPNAVTNAGWVWRTSTRWRSLAMGVPSRAMTSILSLMKTSWGSGNSFPI